MACSTYLGREELIVDFRDRGSEQQPGNTAQISERLQVLLEHDPDSLVR